MTQPRWYVFVLWGAGFEEVPTIIFVSELRRAGLRVKVVGLNMQRLAGAHGVPLLPDMTLEQALPQAHLAIAVIIPCQAKHLVQFSYDPRLAEFLRRTGKGRRTIVIYGGGTLDMDPLRTIPPTDVTIIDYADKEDLNHFTKEISQLLLDSI